MRTTDVFPILVLIALMLPNGYPLLFFHHYQRPRPIKTIKTNEKQFQFVLRSPMSLGGIWQFFDNDGQSNVGPTRAKTYMSMIRNSNLCKQRAMRHSRITRICNV